MSKFGYCCSHTRWSLSFCAAWHARILACKDTCDETNTLHMPRAMFVSLDSTPRVNRRLKKTDF